MGETGEKHIPHVIKLSATAERHCVQDTGFTIYFFVLEALHRHVSIKIDYSLINK
jgi:hypothetical protein